jgi:hypothetical protein
MKMSKKRGIYYLLGVLPLMLAAVLVIVLSGCCLNLSSLVSPTTQTAQTSSEVTQATDPIAEEGDTQASQDETAAQETDDQPGLEGIDGSITTEFSNMVANGEDPINLLEHIDANIDKVNTEAATYMIGEAIRLSEEKKFEFSDKYYADGIQDKIFDALGGSYEVDMAALINAQDAALKALIDETVARKYKVLSTEGVFIPLVDYAAYDIYYDYINDELKDFISVYLDESNQPSILDAGVVISINEFLKRIDKAFVYLENYPDSPRFDKIKQLNGGRLNVYLGGIDNTPVFDGSNKIYPEKLTEMQAFAQQYNGTKLGQILDDYLSLLVQENYIKTSNVDDFLSALYS